MSTESTPLTFVRCPSCRSLVPAVSQRCRMCGYALSAEDASTDKDDDKSAGSRVRQRTMSGSKSELNEAAQMLRSSESHADMADESDHLEVETHDSDDADLDSDVRELSDLNQDSGDEHDPLGAYVVSSEAEENLKHKPGTNGKTSHDVPQKRDEPAQRVVIEQGQKRSGGLSFRGKESNEKVEQAKSPREQSVPQKQKQDSPKLKESRTSWEDEDVSVEENTKRAAPAKNSVQKEQSKKGRLFGWLVSYKDEDGEAYELREGKCFISSKSLKKNDFVIEDDSISTPHAIMTVSSSQGLSIQDLMSERGVFVRTREGQQYVREEDIVALEHGDWVRLGDVEFLVTLIARVGK